MDKRVEVLDIILTKGLFVMLDNVANGEQMFGPPQTRKQLIRLRQGLLDVLQDLKPSIWWSDTFGKEKLQELLDQTEQHFRDAFTSGTFDEY